MGCAPYMAGQPPSGDLVSKAGERTLGCVSSLAHLAISVACRRAVVRWVPLVHRPTSRQFSRERGGALPLVFDPPLAAPLPSHHFLSAASRHHDRRSESGPVLSRGLRRSTNGPPSSSLLRRDFGPPPGYGRLGRPHVSSVFVLCSSHFRLLFRSCRRVGSSWPVGMGWLYTGFGSSSISKYGFRIRADKKNRPPEQPTNF